MEKSNTKKAAILVTDGFEQSEFETPMEALKNEGILTEIVSLKKGKIKGWKEKNWGDEFQVDKTIDEVTADDYDILVLPGGLMNPDALRVNELAIKFINSFFEQGKIIAAICHAPWSLIETGKVKGLQLTSFKSIKTDLINAGAIWKDEEVVVDNKLITSRSPKDLKAFCNKIIEGMKEVIPA